MKTRPDISLLSAEQLRLLVQELYAEVDEKDEVMEEVLFQQNEQTLAFAKQTRQLKLEKRKMQAKIDALETEIQQLKERFFTAEARWEATKNSPPTTIIYGNHATPMYGSTIHEQKNTTNHQTKEDMNIENLNITGGNNLIGDGSTMNVYEADLKKTETFLPSQEKVKEALIALSTEERWEKQQWWAVWKVMMALHKVNKNAREFADYLMNLGVTTENVYNNIYKLDAEFRNISTIVATEWQQYSGKYNDKYQKQIETANRLFALLSK